MDADHFILRTMSLGFPTQVLLKTAPQTRIPERRGRMLRELGSRQRLGGISIGAEDCKVKA